MASSTKGDVPKVSVNGPDGTSVAAQSQSPPSSKEPSPAPQASGSVPNSANKVSVVFSSEAGAYQACSNRPLLIRYLPSLLLLPTKDNA